MDKFMDSCWCGVAEGRTSICRSWLSFWSTSFNPTQPQQSCLWLQSNVPLRRLVLISLRRVAVGAVLPGIACRRPTQMTLTTLWRDAIDSRIVHPNSLHTYLYAHITRGVRNQNFVWIWFWELNHSEVSVKFYILTVSFHNKLSSVHSCICSALLIDRFNN